MAVFGKGSTPKSIYRVPGKRELFDGAGSVLGGSKTKPATMGVEASAIGNTGPDLDKGERAKPCVFCSGETSDSGVLSTDKDGVLGADKVVCPGLGCTGEDGSLG